MVLALIKGIGAHDAPRHAQLGNRRNRGKAVLLRYIAFLEELLEYQAMAPDHGIGVLLRIKPGDAR